MGWIGVDFDGTLAMFHDWVGWNVFGVPIPRMVERIQGWLGENKEVRIVTARIGLPKYHRRGKPVYASSPIVGNKRCRVTEQTYTDDDMQTAIQNWCEERVQRGWRPIVQCYKDGAMDELWDDRAVQVVVNTGRTLAEEHLAELTALKGAP